MVIRYKDAEWHKQSWAYKLGWLHFIGKRQMVWDDAVHTYQHEYAADKFPAGSAKHADYVRGWNDADFQYKVDAGYYDWSEE